MGGDSNTEVLKRLDTIISELSSGKKSNKSVQTPKSSPSPAPNTSAGYKSKNEIFPSDIMMVNMYALITQFSEGY